jgi:hypothetical protein
MLMKRCKATGNLFYPRRENQKFENNKARCNFYNKKYRKMYSEIIKTNKLMFVNYKILSKLIGYRNYMEIEKKMYQIFLRSYIIQINRSQILCRMCRTNWTRKNSTNKNNII